MSELGDTPDRALRDAIEDAYAEWERSDRAASAVDYIEPAVFAWVMAASEADLDREIDARELVVPSPQPAAAESIPLDSSTTTTATAEIRGRFLLYLKRSAMSVEWFVTIAWCVGWIVLGVVAWRTT